jgi:soluble lytic murein transglycosylase-like protein
MRVLRVAVGWVALASFAGVLGFAGAWYFGVASAQDSQIERLLPPGVDTASTQAASTPPPTAFGHDRTMVVKATARPDIVIVSTAQPETERLHRSILAYVAERNPSASMRAFRDYPALVLGEATRTNIDHCLALAQAQAESDFRPDAVGAAGEIGLYQIMPSTAVLFEPSLGTFRKPSLRRYEWDLGDLADPLVSTRFAMAYLRDILVRKPNLRDALTEYNGGPRGRQPHYYRIVMATYVEILERPELGCQVRERRARPPLLQLVRR